MLGVHVLRAAGETTMAREKKKCGRFEIDSSAKFYPIMSTKKAQSLFRLSAIMLDDVDKDVLEVALNDVLTRFDCYKVRLKRGYAWHYFAPNDMPAKVFGDVALLKPIDTDETNGYLFRLCAVKNEIRLDIFHALGDGNAALVFLRSIVHRYRQLLGFDVTDESIINWQSTACDEEVEDGFKKNYKPISFLQMKLGALAGKVPHRMSGTLLKGGYESSAATFDSAEIVKRAKKIGVSFTAYIVGMLGVAIESVSKSKKPITIMVPVDLRAAYPTKSLRNFVMFVRIILTKRDCESVEKCALIAQRDLKIQTAKNKLDAFISTTVRAQKNWILRSAPLVLKTVLLRLGRLFMRSRQTMILSNLGKIDCDSAMGIDRYAFNVNVSKNSTQNVGVITTNGKTHLAITRAVEETALADKLFSMLDGDGIKVIRV